MFLMLIESQEDIEKVERLYAEHHKAVYLKVYSYLHNQELAEEVVQETFIRVIKNLHKIDENDFARTRAFLYITAINVAKNMLKRLKKSENEEELTDIHSSTYADSDLENLIINKETLQKTKEIIEQLDPKYRDVLLLKRVYNMSREEIANFLNISPENVKKRLTRAKAKIVKALEEGEKIV